MKRSLSVEFKIQENTILPLSAKEINMTPGHGTIQEEKNAGNFWIELLDEQDQTVCCKSLRNPFAKQTLVCFPSNQEGDFQAAMVPQNRTGETGRTAILNHEQAVSVAFFDESRCLVGKATIASLLIL